MKVWKQRYDKNYCNSWRGFLACQISTLVTLLVCGFSMFVLSSNGLLSNEYCHIMIVINVFVFLLSFCMWFFDYRNWSKYEYEYCEECDTWTNNKRRT